MMSALPDYWAAMTLPNRIEFSKAVVTGPRGGIVLVRSIQDAYDFINDYAPEHLEVLSSEPFKHLAGITNASEVLLGSRTPVTIANFMLGPNGVLPTGGWARTFGPLSVTERYGPYTTAYNRFNRWAKRRVWGAVFSELAQRSPDSLRMIDSTVVRAHQHAAAPKKTAKKRSGARAAA